MEETIQDLLQEMRIELGTLTTEYIVHGSDRIMEADNLAVANDLKNDVLEFLTIIENNK